MNVRMERKEERMAEGTTWRVSATDPTPVSRLMRRSVICAHAEQLVTDVARLLVEKSIGGAPVVDARGKLLGMVSKTDVIRSQFLAPAPERARTVADVMTPVAFTVPENATVLAVADVMMRAGVHRVVIVDALDRVSGIVSSLDIIRWVAQQGA
jgi:CBS domain-containing protein